jgi:hypothetical protein
VTAGNNWQRAWATVKMDLAVPMEFSSLLSHPTFANAICNFKQQLWPSNTPEDDSIDESIREHEFEVEYKF